MPCIVPFLLLFFALLVPAVGQVSTPAVDAPDVMAQTYVVAPGDVLDIGVQGQPEFARTVTVSPDGVIFYVGIKGPILAAGHTVPQLRALLTQSLLRQFKRPLVTISLRETHPRRVSVLGAVRLQGVYEWRPGMRLLEALGLAQGLAQVPELTQGTLITQNGARSIPLDMTKLATDGDSAQNAVLLPGDIVLVSLRDPEKATVQVTGQVVHPGPVNVPPGGASIVSVLNLAGGFTASAALTQVQIVHEGQTRTLNLHPLLFHIDDPVGQERVVAGDVVNVPLNNTHIDIYGEVRDPGRFALQDGEPLTLTGALALAHGPTDQAQREKIGIVRDVHGQKTLYEVNANTILRGQDGAQNIVLQPGDTIVVPKRRAGVNGFQALGTAVGAIFGVVNVGRL